MMKNPSEHLIFDLASIEKIRERVYHLSNRVEPFNQALLMERCLRDIGSRMARQGLSASAPSASLGAPIQVTQAAPVQPAASATITVAPVPAAAAASQSSGQTAPRQIYGVTQEEAEFRQARKPQGNHNLCLLDRHKRKVATPWHNPTNGPLCAQDAHKFNA